MKKEMKRNANSWIHLSSLRVITERFADLGWKKFPFNCDKSNLRSFFGRLGRNKNKRKSHSYGRESLERGIKNLKKKQKSKKSKEKNRKRI